MRPCWNAYPRGWFHSPLSRVDPPWNSNPSAPGSCMMREGCGPGGTRGRRARGGRGRAWGARGHRERARGVGRPIEEAGEVLAAGDAVAAQRGLVRGEAELALPLVDEVRVRVDRRVETREVLGEKTSRTMTKPLVSNKNLSDSGMPESAKGRGSRRRGSTRETRPTNRRSRGAAERRDPSRESRAAPRARTPLASSRTRGTRGDPRTDPRVGRSARGRDGDGHDAASVSRGADDEINECEDDERAPSSGCRRPDFRVRTVATTYAHVGAFSPRLPPLTLASRPSPRGFEPLTPASSHAVFLLSGGARGCSS